MNGVAPAQTTSAFGPHTWAEFVALPEEDRRELIDGWFVETEVPTLLHEKAIVALSGWLFFWAMQRNAGSVVSSAYKVKVSEKRGVMPDIQFYRTGNERDDQVQARTEGRPDLAVEVISPGSRKYDQVTKLNWYAQLGVPEYWLVDLEARTLHRFQLNGGTYSVREAVSDDAVLRPDSFPGLEIPLSTVWGRSQNSPADQ